MNPGGWHLRGIARSDHTSRCVVAGWVRLGAGGEVRAGANGSVCEGSVRPFEHLGCGRVYRTSQRGIFGGHIPNGGEERTRGIRRDSAPPFGPFSSWGPACRLRLRLRECGDRAGGPPGTSVPPRSGPRHRSGPHDRTPPSPPGGGVPLARRCRERGTRPWPQGRGAEEGPPASVSPRVKVSGAVLLLPLGAEVKVSGTVPLHPSGAGAKVSGTVPLPHRGPR